MGMFTITSETPPDTDTPQSNGILERLRLPARRLKHPGRSGGVQQAKFLSPENDRDSLGEPDT